MKFALVNAQDIVVNVVVYDGAEYQPPAGLRLLEINDWLEIGDHKDKLKPVPVQDDPAKRKEDRDRIYKNDLAIVAAFEIEKKSNPDLEFSNYLDSLEQKRDNMKSR